MLLQETKQVALNTTETLANQTNQIGNMKGDVEEIDNKLKRSEQVSIGLFYWLAYPNILGSYDDW